MTKLFVTGATGFIGGDAFYAIANAHPEYEITALVRNSDKGAQVAKEYPNVKLAYGDLDSTDLLEEEAKKADIVCHWAHADHEASAIAIAKGLAAHEPSRPGFFIHTSGTGILLFADIKSGTYGEALDKVYDDLKNVSEVTSLPDFAPHRNVDKIVLQAGTEHQDRVKTAIVSPPTIYGPGRGPGNKRSHQVPELARSTLERGAGLKVGAGKTFWGDVHVHDLSDLYLKLVEEAAAGGSTAEWPGKPATWGAEGY
ncbi:NAD(P)-binding protein, partial [Hortaea werneckii]